MAVTRRAFQAQSAAALGLWALGANHLKPATAKEPEDLPQAEARQAEARIVAYNVCRCEGWPKVGQRLKDRGQLPEQMSQALAELKLDLATLAEAPRREVCQGMADRMGMKCQYWDSVGSYPGALLTRWEVLEAQNRPAVDGACPAELFTRHWGRAVLRTPSGASLVVHSVHFHPTKRDVRRREIALLAARLNADQAGEGWTLVQGDFNLTPDSADYRQLRESGLVDTFAQAGKGDGLTFPTPLLQHRIDYIFASAPLARLLTYSSPLSTAPFGWKFGAGRIALSDHLPQSARFRLG